MYGKLFEQMYRGTLAKKGPWQALITFQQLIILADKDGVVDMTDDAISRITTIPLQIIQEGLQELIKPDPGSRNPAEEGRRIVLLSDHRDWGWRIVNYAVYNKIRSEEERREYHRKYWHMRKKKGNVETQQLNRASTNSTPIDVDVDVSIKPTTTARTGKPRSNGVALNKEKVNFDGLSDKDILSWQEMFPAISVPLQISRAASWCISNPAKGRKSNYRRFLHSWLSNAQDKGAPIK